METIKPNKMDLPPVTIDEPFSLVSIVGTLDDESVVFDGIECGTGITSTVVNGLGFPSKPVI